MKRFATFASCALLATLFACHSDQSATPVAAGAVEGGSKCCTKDGSCSDKCTAGSASNMGAVDGKTCDKPCAKTCPATGASMGAVEGQSCTKPCDKPCPATGASMGAVEGQNCSKTCDKPCSKSATTTNGASMGAVGGAVGGKSGCCKGATSGCTK